MISEQKKQKLIEEGPNRIGFYKYIFKIKIVQFVSNSFIVSVIMQSIKKCF